MTVGTVLVFLFFFDTALIYLIYSYNPSGSINRFMSLMLVPITLTNLEMLFLYTARQNIPVEIGLNMSTFGVIFFFPLFYHFSWYFPRRRVKIHTKQLFILLYFIPLVLGISLIVTFDPQSSILSLADIIHPGRYILKNPLYFALHSLALTYILFLLTLTIYRIIISLKLPLLKRERRAVIMVLTGFIPLSVVLLFNYLIFLPLRGGIYYYLVLSSSYTIYFILLVFEFGYIDRKALSRFFIIYPLTLVTIIFLYNKLLRELNRIISENLYISTTFLTSLEIVVFFIFFYPLMTVLESKVGSFIAPAPYSLREQLRSASSELASIIDIEELNDYLVKLFIQKLRITSFFFLIRDESAKLFRPVAHGGENQPEFSVNGELVRKLEASRKINNIQQIALSWEKGKELEILDNLRVSLIVPLFSKNTLEGICLLGEQGIARPWHKPEIDELELFFAGIPVIIERWKTHSKAIQMEQRQARVEKIAVLNAITSEVAHEIRNPLSIITAIAETIQSKNLSHEEILKFINDIREETERVSTLLKKILSVPTNTKKGSDSCDLKEALTRTFRLVSQKAREKHISLELICNYDHCYARINREAFIQVCLNLSLNAIEALQEYGSIRAIVEKKDSSAIVNFSDNGPGIPESVASRIFEPFFSTKRGGTGLGLAVSKRIIEEAGGKLELLAGNNGATFLITLLA